MGKSSFCAELVARLGAGTGSSGVQGDGSKRESPLRHARHLAQMKHIAVGQRAEALARASNCTRDDERDCLVLDSAAEDQLLDELEVQAAKGGCVLDYHCNELFPERWADLVVVLTCDCSVLRERLHARNYSRAKVEENVECEMMQVVLDEARSSYRPEIVWHMANDNLTMREANLDRLVDWIRLWYAAR